MATLTSSASSDAGAFLIPRSIQHFLRLSHATYRYAPLILITWLGLSSYFAHAQTDSNDPSDEPAQLEEVVSATRQITRLEQTSAFGEVLNLSELQDDTALALDEILDQAQHLQIHSYGPGGLSSLRLRGASSEQVLILVDGERLNHSQSGGADLSQILINGVQRVEILRGGQSALYGADAMGGVIYIVTQRVRRPELSFSTGAGSFGYQQWQTDAKAVLGDVGLGLSYARNQSENAFEFTNLYGNIRTRTNADHRHQNLQLRVEWQSVGQLQITGEHYDSDQGVPGPVGQTSELAYQKDLNNGVRVRWKHAPNDRFDYQVQGYARHRTLHYYHPEPIQINSLHKLDSTGIEVQTRTHWRSSRSPLVLGAALRRDAAESNTIGIRERDALGIYLQQEWQRGRLTLFPALRLDIYSDFDAGISPKLGWRAKLTPVLTLKGNVGRSYRAPTLNDLYWPEDSFTRGNPDLLPERSTDFDVGVQLRQRGKRHRLAASAVFFQNRFRNRILWAPLEGGKWTPTNLAEATHQGLETEGEFQIGPVRASLAYTWIDAEDEHGNQLIYNAMHTIQGALQIEKGPFRASWHSHYESKRYVTRSNTRYLEPYLRHDLRFGGRRSITDSLSLRVMVEIRNLFDTEYRLVKDYPLPGREARFKASIQWGGNP